MWTIIFALLCTSTPVVPSTDTPTLSPGLNYDDVRSRLTEASKTADAIDISALKLAPFATDEFKHARGDLALAAEWFAGQADLTKECWNLQGLTLLLQALDFGEVSLSKLQTAVEKSGVEESKSAAAIALEKQSVALDPIANDFRKRLMKFFEGLDQKLKRCGGNSYPAD
jgi:hypothetical protein